MSAIHTQAIHPQAIHSQAIHHLTSATSATSAMDRLAAFRSALSAAVNVWRKRSRNPLRLYQLNDHVLKDMGLSKAQIGHGPAESLWRM